MAALRAPNGDYAARPGEATRMAVALRRSALPPAVSAPSAKPRQRCRGPAPMTGLRIGRTVSHPVQPGRAHPRGTADSRSLGRSGQVLARLAFLAGPAALRPGRRGGGVGEVLDAPGHVLVRGGRVEEA